MEAKTHRDEQLSERPVLRRILVPTDLTPIADVVRTGDDLQACTGILYTPWSYLP